MKRNEKLERTYRAERHRLIAWLQARTGDEAEDILQDVVFRTMVNLDTLEPMRDLAAWLWRGARNAVIDSWRRRSRRRRLGETDIENFDAVVDDAWRSAADELEREELLEALSKAMDALPREQREVIEAQELNGETFKAISERTGVAIETLAARKRYALAKLRAALKEYTEA